MDQFLKRLGAVLNWEKIESLLPELNRDSLCSNLDGGQMDFPRVLLRIAVIQYCYRLSDSQCQEQISDRISWREFIGATADEHIPDAQAIRNFRIRLGENGLGSRLINLCNELLAEKGLLLKLGVLENASLVELKSSASAERGRDRNLRIVFERSMDEYLRDPAAALKEGSTLIEDLIYGWGNTQWSALEEYLRACIQHALVTSGPILECGSGLSTIVVGAISKRRRIKHWALEHESAWAARVRRYLKIYALDSVVLCSKPLKDYGEFLWYDLPWRRTPKEFSLVLCDGPPGNTRGGRYGLVPVLRERFAPRCEILLDDAGREGERAIAKRWQAELGGRFEILGINKPYIKMQLGSTV